MLTALSSPPLSMQQVNALSARHRCAVSRRDAFHVSSMGGLLVPRIAHYPAVLVQGMHVTLLPSVSEPGSHRSHPDVLVPDGGVGADEPPHQLDAAGIVQHIHGHAPVPQQIFLAPKRDVLGDHDAWDAVQENRAGAHGAWGKGRVQNTSCIYGGRKPAGIL